MLNTGFTGFTGAIVKHLFCTSSLPSPIQPLRVAPTIHITTLPHKKCVDTMNMGGRAYPVRHYPIAIRLRDLAFGNMVAMIVDTVNIRATCASALPTHSRSSWGPHNILSHSMYCTISSVWGHFGCFTRSAFRRTPSPPSHLPYLPLWQSFCVWHGDCKNSIT